MAFDPAEQRRIMGSFATGVTVVTTNSNPPTGLTANAVTSLSLDPPLVLVAVDKKGGSHHAIKDAGCFAMNILTSSQQNVSNKFATPGPKDFSDLNIKTAKTGAPIRCSTSQGSTATLLRSTRSKSVWKSVPLALSVPLAVDQSVLPASEC